MKIQDGGQGGLEKNANIGFQIHKTLSFPKMYSFHFLQKIPTGVLIWNIGNWTNCFESTNWDVFIDACDNIDELNDTVSSL